MVKIRNGDEILTKKKIKTKLGRPKKWNNSLELEECIKNYFRFCQKERRIPGICGLASWLGISRTTLLRYENNNEDVTINEVICRARTEIEAYNEQLLYNNKTFQGAQFIMKNNFNYSEKHLIEGNIGIENPSAAEILKSINEQLQRKND